MCCTCIIHNPFVLHGHYLTDFDPNYAVPAFSNLVVCHICRQPSRNPPKPEHFGNYTIILSASSFSNITTLGNPINGCPPHAAKGPLNTIVLLICQQPWAVFETLTFSQYLRTVNTYTLALMGSVRQCTGFGSAKSSVQMPFQLGRGAELSTAAMGRLISEAILQASRVGSA